MQKQRFDFHCLFVFPAVLDNSAQIYRKPVSSYVFTTRLGVLYCGLSIVSSTDLQLISLKKLYYLMIFQTCVCIRLFVFYFFKYKYPYTIKRTYINLIKNIYTYMYISQNYHSLNSCIQNYLHFHYCYISEVRKRKRIRNRYNQAPHLTQDTNGKVTTLQLDIINESQAISPFPASDHKASIKRRTRKHNKNKTEITSIIHKRSTALEGSVKIFFWRA